MPDPSEARAARGAGSGAGSARLPLALCACTGRTGATNRLQASGSLDPRRIVVQVSRRDLFELCVMVAGGFAVAAIFLLLGSTL